MKLFTAFDLNQVNNSFKKMAEEKLMIYATFAPRKIKFSLYQIVKKAISIKLKIPRKI